MPKSKYNHRSVNIKGDLLDKLVLAHLVKLPTTRAAVADRCNVSKTTAGKVATALFECRFVTQKLCQQSNGRAAQHLTLRKVVSAMVIDLSRPRYAMIITNAYGECSFERYHNFDAKLSYEDNLTTFLSRCGYEARLAGHRPDAICVVYSGATDNGHTVCSSLSAYLPSAQDKDKTLRIVGSVFGRRPTIYASLSEIISASVDLEIVPSGNRRLGASYLFIGTYPEAFNVLGDTVTRCDAGSVLLDSRSVGMAMENRLIQSEFEDVLVRLVNMMSCAFCPSVIIIQSDIYRIDQNTLSSVSRRLAEGGILCPDIVNSKTVILEAAARLATVPFIRRYLTSTYEKQQ